MRRILRVRNVLLAIPAVLVVLIGACVAEFAYRTNSCGPRDHVLLSAEDAIAVAKKKMVKIRKFSSDSFGSAPDFVDSLDGVKDCCFATRSRNSSFVIVWNVVLSNEAEGRNNRAVYLSLANCGGVFEEDSYVDSGY